MNAKTNKCRARAPNFSKEEQLLFLRVMKSFTHIIESKKTGEVKTAHKQETWSKITKIFNADTRSVHRTTENLISCYRNMKSKIKKQHSDAKMILADSNEKQNLLEAIGENERDWDAVSEYTDQPAELCEKQFDRLQKEGGGPLPSDDDPLDQLKKPIEPQVDAIYSIDDDDSCLMQHYQESMPEKDRIMPIENNFDKTEGCPKTKKNVKKKFSDLSEAKLELVQLQKDSLRIEIEHKKLMNHLEFEETIKENKHKDEMRRRELLLIDLKIKQLSE